MRALAHPLIVTMLLGACAAPPSTVESLTVGDARASVPGYGFVPDAVRAPPKLVQAEAPSPSLDGPRLQLVDRLDPRCGTSPCIETMLCEFVILGEGLPAARADGGAVVHFVHSPNVMDVIELAMGTVGGERKLHTLIDETEMYDVGREGLPAACMRAETELLDAIATVNDELDGNGWRQMKRIPVEVVPGPDTAADDPGPETRPANERPVQVRLRNGRYVARVPGVRVLHHEEWKNASDIDIGDVWVDAETGAALQTYAVTNQVCSAGMPELFDARMTRLPAEVLAEAERRQAFVYRY